MKHPENSSEYKGLTVNAGVENLPSVNPYATFRRKKQVLAISFFLKLDFSPKEGYTIIVKMVKNVQFLFWDKIAITGDFPGSVRKLWQRNKATVMKVLPP